MTFIIVILCLALLIVLISYFKVDAFISFLVTSIVAGIALGIPLEKLPQSIDVGVGSIMGSLTLIIVLGAMLGKLVAESGAAQKIASVMVDLFGTKYIQWGANDNRVYCGYSSLLRDWICVIGAADFFSGQSI